MSLVGSLQSQIRANSAILKAVKKVHVIAGSTALAEQKQRIFVRGEDSNEKEIGQYSTDPTYVGASSFLTKAGASRVLGSKRKRARLYGSASQAGTPGFVPKKKPGPGGKGAIYFPDGYEGIRDADGRPFDKVNLDRSGKMRFAYQFDTLPNGFVLGFINDADYLKMKGNEKRFRKDIVSITNRVELLVNDIYNREISKIIGRR